MSGLRPRGLLRRTLRRFPRLFVALLEPDDADLGELGEEVAARHLARSGWRILARRLRTRSGEADLVVSRGATLAVVEVKTARVSHVPKPSGRTLSPNLELRWRPGYRCDARRLARLRRVAREFPGNGRVDLVEVLLEGRPRRFRVLHHEDLREPLA